MLISVLKRGYLGSSCACATCQENAKFKSYRPKTFLSLCGDLKLSRGYYYCSHCNSGSFPWDKTLRFTSRQLTPAAEEVLALAGCYESFAPAAEKVLGKLSGLRTSEATTRRTTEDAGARLQQALKDKIVFGRRKQWPWRRDARNRSCAYVSLDHTGIRQQGPGGTKAEGRMAAVAMIYDPQDRDSNERLTARYIAGFESFDELIPKLRREAAQVGWDDAEQQIALSDGGAGLENFFRRSFPQAVVILDFWHVSERLGILAEALHGGDDDQRLKQKETWCHLLKQKGGQALLEELESIDLRGGKKAAKTCLGEQKNYVRNNVHRMNYPEYVANGWRIGSGPVEAACKHVIGARLKGSGRRWSEAGSDRVSHLRALLLSENDAWEDFWYPELN